MRRFGALLMMLGLLLGAVVGGALLLNVSIPGASWLVAAGLAKLALGSAVGLLAAGAVLQRLAAREDERRRLSPTSPAPGPSPELDEVDEASQESFPASDPPSWEPLHPGSPATTPYRSHPARSAPRHDHPAEAPETER
jgi:hypothetical protein